MNYLDIAISAPILYGLIKGVSNGLIKEIPISAVTYTSLSKTFSEIKHKNFNRIVNIYSGLSSGFTDAGAVVSQIENAMTSFPEDLGGINIDYTGQLEEENKNQLFLLKAFFIGYYLFFYC